VRRRRIGPIGKTVQPGLLTPGWAHRNYRALARGAPDSSLANRPVTAVHTSGSGPLRMGQSLPVRALLPLGRRSPHCAIKRGVGTVSNDCARKITGTHWPRSAGVSVAECNPNILSGDPDACDSAGASKGSTFRELVQARYLVWTCRTEESSFMSPSQRPWPSTVIAQVLPSLSLLVPSGQMVLLHVAPVRLAPTRLASVRLAPVRLVSLR